MSKKQRYSEVPRPEIVEEARKYAGLSRQQLMDARARAVARKDWLAMQTITYVLTITYEERF